VLPVFDLSVNPTRGPEGAVTAPRRRFAAKPVRPLTATG